MAAPGRTPFSSAGNAYSFDGPPDLAFEVRPLRGIPSLLVDETVPDIDVADVALLGLGKCRQCKFMNACGGGYLPHRFSRNNGYDNPSVYCDGLYATYQHIQSVLEDHLYVSRPGREPLRIGDELARV